MKLFSLFVVVACLVLFLSHIPSEAGVYRARVRAKASCGGVSKSREFSRSRASCSGGVSRARARRSCAG